MSLVICSNNESDEASRRQDSSVYKAWSFRNDLSSTYTIPPNSQVALQSCKVNIDGRVSVSSSNNKFYTFFGTKLNRNGTTAPQMKDCTSHPVLVDMSGGQNQVLELSKNDFANQVQKELRSATYHPDVKGKPTVEVLQNASSLDFKGYKITMDQNLDRDNSIPSNGAFTQYFAEVPDYENNDDIFSYNNGVFTRNPSNNGACSAISKELPLTTTTGLFVVNVSGTNATANASGVEWHVALSRSVNNPNIFYYYVPNYADLEYDDGLNLDEEFFADFAVARNQDGQLVVYQWQVKVADGEYLVRREVQYWNNASSDYNGAGRADISADNITDVRFTVEGERVKVELYNATSAAWLVVTQYNPAGPKPSMFKPVLQTCWCLHPVLCISRFGNVGTVDGCSMEITHFDTPRDLTDYDPTVFQKSGWWESMEIIGKTALCWDVDARSLFSFGAGLSTVYQQRGVNASNGVDYDNPVFIFQPSEIYVPSPGANATELLGFNALVDTATSNPSLSEYIYESVNIPSLVSPLSLFVRLDNLGQNSFNARSKNKSKILAHLTTLENKVGRQTYEPSNLVYIDLDNPYELKLTSFDISFTYINEQFATILTGQSIVSLLFRQKSKGEY